MKSSRQDREAARDDLRRAQRVANEDAVLAEAAKLDPADRSRRAEHLREVAGSIADHRESERHRES
jgi:hypothetical protein